MNYELKTQVEITLKLTQEEFNTIVCAYGASNVGGREEVATRHDLKLVNYTDSDKLYCKLLEIAKSICKMQNHEH